MPALPVTSFARLLAVAGDELGRLDIALVNLLCAEGLPGAEGLNIARCLATLDRWAQAIRCYTRDAARYYQRDPTAYGHHKGFAELVSMAILLKRGIGIRYQPAAIASYDFSDSRDDLLHGLLTRKLGTCASLPVLVVALGRRLGYPMYLAVAQGHFFCQWLNDDDSHVNFEISGNNGECSRYDDEHYHQWPRPLTAAHLSSGRYLRALNPCEELAAFLETRGHCLADNGRYDEAREAYEQAHRAAPDWSRLDDHLLHLALQCDRDRLSHCGPKFASAPPVSWHPTINASVPNRNMFPSLILIPGLTR